MLFSSFSRFFKLSSKSSTNPDPKLSPNSTITPNTNTNTKQNSLAQSHNSMFGAVKLLFALFLCGCLVILFLLHISIGASKVPLAQVWEAIVHFNPKNFSHIIVWNLRFPRAIIALTVGAALAVAGALMQGITRNPLADPGLLGLTHGASFAAVMSVSVFGISSGQWLPAIAASGALGAAVLVWLIAVSARANSSTLTLVLSGVAVTTFLGAGIALFKFYDSDTFDQLRHWLVGSLTGANLKTYWYSLPWMLIGLVLALLVSRQITIFSMGDETATSLGVNVNFLKTVILLAVVMLTAASVALVGPLGFIGLIIPHVVRIFVGYDYRFIIPFSALFGAVYLLFIDIVSRWILSPIELTTGIVTAMLGAPLFVWLVRAKL